MFLPADNLRCQATRRKFFEYTLTSPGTRGMSDFYGCVRVAIRRKQWGNTDLVLFPHVLLLEAQTVNFAGR